MGLGNDLICQKRDLYLRRDVGEDTRPVFVGGVSDNDACQRVLFENQKEWGVAWTVNRFDGDRRLKANVKEILSWVVDLDSESKEEQIKKIKSFFLEPSMVIETARGHHVYFNADNAKLDPDLYRETNKLLAQSLGGDMNACDAARLLRAPYHLHWKNPKNPFLIKIIHESDVLFTQERLNRYLVKEKKEVRPNNNHVKRFIHTQHSGEIDCLEALKELSGSKDVCGETYSFTRVSNGNYNISVNGKPSSCFVDREGKIGSSDGGGPTIFQWLYYLHRDKERVREIIKRRWGKL